jgi:hypothetical protein
MADEGPWTKYAAPAQAGPWEKYGGSAPAAPAPAPKPFGMLPMREDPDGSFHLDLSQGITGALWNAVSAPRDAMQGKFAPGSPEAVDRAFGAAAVMTPANPAMRAGERALPGVLQSTRRQEPKVPTAQELKTASGGAYDAARATGAEYPGVSIGSMADRTMADLQEQGILGELAPQTFSIIGKLQNPPEGAVVTIASLDAARKALNRVAGNFGNPTEQEAARRVIQRIDEIIEGAGNAAGAPGNRGPVSPVSASPGGAGAADGAGAGGVAEDALSQAARLIREARGNAAASFRSDRLTGKVEQAENRAAAANSGQNIGNTIRQRLVDILNNDKLKRGLSDEEVAAIQQVVDGTASSNTLRRVSNWLGGGGGLGQTVLSILGAAGGGAAGGGVGAGAGAALPLALGSGTRMGYNALVGRQAGKVDELIRKRSPLYQQRQEQAPMLPSLWDVNSGVLMRGLLGSYPQSGLLGNEP